MKFTKLLIAALLALFAAAAWPQSATSIYGSTAPGASPIPVLVDSTGRLLVIANIQAFAPLGNTITFTANTSGNIPTPVQAVPVSGTATQYLISNTGVNLAFISYANSAALATANCVVPTGTSTLTVPVLPGSAVVITAGTSYYFCGITSSGTSVIYVTPGAGL